MAYLASVGRTADSRVDAIMSGYRWGGGAVTWSTPDAASDYGAGYSSDNDGDGRSAQYDGFARLTKAQAGAMTLGLEGTTRWNAAFSVEGFTGLELKFAGAGSGAGDIRAASAADAATSYAYLPGNGIGGDVWLGGSGRVPRAGNYDHATVLHETGHAMGLKHTTEVWGKFGALPEAWDSPEFTVMTYRPWEGGSPTGYHFEKWSAPQTWMMLDIAALQEMYGADYTTNAGNTTYRWTPGSGRTYVDGHVAIDPGGNRIFATVWDGGGVDTYDLSAYRTGVRVDLRPGSASTFSKGQLADLNGGPNDGHARGNIFNALQHDDDRRSLIENAVGGSGADRLTGNAAANRLFGGAGKDRLDGDLGRDVLIGGRGDDVFVFRSAAHSPEGNFDRIMSGGGARAFQGAGRASGDKIDLHDIDANVGRAGDQAFVFGHGKGAGHLWVTERHGVSYVAGNIDDDRAPELVIAIHDGAVKATAYTHHDFIL